MKVLIIRFSSFGDIVQAMSVVDDLVKEKAIVHWVTHIKFASLVKLNPHVEKVWGLERQQGFFGLWNLILTLKKEKYDIIYDAHSSLRSYFLGFILSPLGGNPFLIRRSKQRLRRLLLFFFRINTFPKPYRGIVSYRRPLEVSFPSMEKDFVSQKWIFPETNQRHPWGDQAVVLCPSAAWKMKRWPLPYWKRIIMGLPQALFVVLGGLQDGFCEDLTEVAPCRVVNLAGKLSLVESCAMISCARLVIAGDTGMIHVADLLGVPGISLIGPTAFGYPTGRWLTVLDVPLSCRPCSKDGRGRCIQKVWQKCMVDISPERVIDTANRILG